MPHRKIPIPRHPIIHRKRGVNSSGLTQNDQMLNYIRTKRFPSNNPKQPFQFPSPAKDVSYSNLTLVFNRSRNGLVPKDLRVNHIRPILVV